MGDQAGLKIVIGADVQDAIKGVDAVAGSLNDAGKSSLDFSKRFAEALKRVSDNVDKMVEDALKIPEALGEGIGAIPGATAPAIRSIDDLTAAMEELRTKISGSTDLKQIESLNAELKRTQTQLNNLKVVTGLKNVSEGFEETGKSVERFGHKTSQSTQLARFAVLDFGHVLRDLPYALSNPALLTGPIDRTAQLMTELTQVTGGAKNAFKAFGSVLAGPGGILIGIELITTAAALLFGKMEHGAEGAKDKLSDYQKTLEEVGKSVGDQAEKATTLFNALNSGTLNTEQRKKALSELKDVNVEYFGSLKDEKGIIEGLSQAYDGYLKRLDDIGRAKAIESQLAKLFDKKLELELKIDPKFNAAVDPATQQQIGKLKKQLESLGGEVDVTKIKDQNVLEAQDNKTLQQRISLQQRIQTLEEGTSYLRDKGYLQARRAVDLVDLQIKGLSQLQKDTGNFDIKADKPAKDTAKTIDDLLEKIKRAQDELSKPNKDPLFKQLGQSLLPDDLSGVALLRQKIADAIAEGNKIGTDRAKSLARELGDLYEQQIKRIQNPQLRSSVDFTLANPADVTKASDKLESEILKTFGKQIQVKVPLDVSLRIEGSPLDDEDKKVLLKKATEDALKNIPVIRWDPKIQAIIDSDVIATDTLEKLNKAVNTIKKGIAASGVGEIGIAIGDALSGKGFQNAISGFEQILGDGLIEIGKKLILASTIIKGIQTALGKLFTNPIAGIVAGVAAIALGEVLKNSVAKTGAHAFATGGIVTGPTLGLVGEAGPEVIFPLNQLNRFIQGTRGNPGQDINVRGMISGNNIRLSLARTNKQQGLV